PLRIRAAATFIYAWSILRNTGMSFEQACLSALQRDSAGAALLKKQQDLHLALMGAVEMAEKIVRLSGEHIDVMNMAVEREKMISELQIAVATLKKLQRT
ncbi:MAG: hypothetical protein LCH53_14040, partial [Bacteroidetes bacterium]|nr:hypothetical protein [Bacteroidota bacterium]